VYAVFTAIEVINSPFSKLYFIRVDVRYVDEILDDLYVYTLSI
jgi:hypothetical protein